MRQASGLYKDLLTTVRKHKLRWYGHITRSMIVQDMVQGGTRKGRQKKRWEDNISEWAGLGWLKPFERQRTERNGEKWLPDHP